MTRKEIAVVAINIVFILGCANVMKYQISDHYEGKKFFNPTQKDEHGLWDAMKMGVSIRLKKWPDAVENRPALNLNCALTSGQAAITFVNHATVLIQFHGLNILTDPVWSDRASPFQWIGPKRVRKPGIDFKVLPKIDIVLLSHNHYDHMDLATLRNLGKRFSPRVFVPLGDKMLLSSDGIENVNEMDWWDTSALDSNIKITFTPTQHFSSRGLLDRNASLWGSYMIESNGHRIYFGGDAAYSAHFKEINRRLGPADIALIPIGAYEPRWFMKAVHMNPEEAVKAHIDLQSRLSVGIHFGTFQLTEEEIDAPVKDLYTAILSNKLDPKTFVTLGEGVTTIYDLGTR